MMLYSALSGGDSFGAVVLLNVFFAVPALVAGLLVSFVLSFVAFWIV
jgi:hypothetical protein